LVACGRADYPAAQSLAAQGLSLARGDGWAEAWLHAVAGRAALRQGALEHAKAELEAGLELARQHDEPKGLTVFILDALGELAMALGRSHQARSWLSRSLELQYNGGERNWMPETLERAAALSAACAQPERALRLAGAAAALYEDLGATRTPAEQKNLDRWLVPLCNAVGELTADELMSQGRAVGLDDAVALARGGDDTGTQRQAIAPGTHGTSVLTAREKEVTELLTRGLSNRQIAEQLVITQRTVAAHVEHILSKLGFASRHQVSAWAAEQDLTN
jgi:DNA-binding CsgD family transcriptional regulator